MGIFVFEKKWADDVLSAMFPPEPQLGGKATDFGAGFSDIVSGAPFEPRFGLRLALFMVVIAPVIVLKRPRFFGSLSDVTQRHVLDELMKSSIYAVRQLVLALKTMGALLYARDPEIRKRMLTPMSPKSQPVSGYVALSKKGAKSHAA